MQEIAKIAMVVSMVLSVTFAPSDAQMIDPCKKLMIIVVCTESLKDGVPPSMLPNNFQLVQYTACGIACKGSVWCAGKHKERLP